MYCSVAQYTLFRTYNIIQRYQNGLRDVSAILNMKPPSNVKKILFMILAIHTAIFRNRETLIAAHANKCSPDISAT